MFIRRCAILTYGFFIFPFLAAAYPASLDKVEPVAQVYDVQGKVTVKNSTDGNIIEVGRGSLLGLDDSLTLDKNASIALYFKSGGRKEIKGNDARSAYKVADLLPKVEAYGQNAQLFGASRGINSPQSASYPGSFFYPQEAVILDSPPLIEFILFNGPGEKIALGKATVQIVKNGAVLDSRRFDSLKYGSSYVHGFAKFEGQTEYKVDLRVELQQAPGNIAISFPLYIAGISDPASSPEYASFIDPVYRSFEAASIDHKGKKRTIAAVKQLARRGTSPQPVIVIEIFIP